MLDNENIMTAKASEVAQKVPTDEEDCIIERCYNWPMMSFIQVDVRQEFTGLSVTTS